MPKEKGDSRGKHDDVEEEQKDKSQLEKAASWVDDALSPQKEEDDERDKK